MYNLLSCVVLMSMSFSAAAAAQNVAERSAQAELRAAKEAFERAYETNDVETYFSFYAEGATVYVGGSATGDVPSYREMWSGMVEAGGGVELNKLTDLQIRVTPSGDAGVATCFIENRTRQPDGARASSNAFQTDVWQKIDGKWKIIHLHYSDVPAEE